MSIPLPWYAWASSWNTAYDGVAGPEVWEETEWEDAGEGGPVLGGWFWV
jgi:hypothetical protein